MARTLRRNVTRSEEPVDDVHPEEQEERAPRGRRRTAADDKPARRRGGEEEDEKATRPRGEVASGWDGYDKNRVESSDYAPEFSKVLRENKDTDILFKFIDEAPFAVYKQHWITRTGKQSFNCIAKKGKGCPLCEELGDRPGNKIAFNVISLFDPEDPKVMVWTVGQKVADIIKKAATEKRTSPINRDDLYFAASLTGKKGGSVQTNIEAIKERDLKDDWDTEPLSEDEINEFFDKAYDAESIDYPSAKQMEEVVDEQLD
jgi:hypothetical protein